MNYHSALLTGAGLAALATGLATAPAAAAPLTGNGSNMVIPTINPGAPANQARATPTLVTGGWTSSWTSPAAAAWVGSFSVSGPIPAGSTNPTGLSRYVFNTLPTNVLPTGTFFRLGDLDGGSATAEAFELRAFDSAGGAITTAWLSEAVGVAGVGTGTAGAILPNNMPSWDFNSTTGLYTFTGATVTGGNPSISVYMESLTNIATLEVFRAQAFANFSLHAPLSVPAPGGAVALLMVGLAPTVRRRRG